MGTVQGAFVRLGMWGLAALFGAVTVAGLSLAGTGVEARDVSPAVKRACANDYFAHCSMHAVGTPGVRSCMRAVGPRLTKPCIQALVSAGEVTSADRRRYKQAKLH